MNRHVAELRAINALISKVTHTETAMAPIIIGLQQKKGFGPAVVQTLQEEWTQVATLKEKVAKEWAAVSSAQRAGTILDLENLMLLKRELHKLVTAFTEGIYADAKRLSI